MNIWQWWWSRFYYNAGTLSRFAGLRYHRTNYFRSAERLFSRTLELDENLHRARLNRGILRYRELGDWKAAIHDFSELIHQTRFVDEALFNRGMAYYQGADYEAAANDFEQFLEIAPESEWAEAAFVQLHMMRSIIDDLPRRLNEPPETPRLT